MKGIIFSHLALFVANAIYAVNYIFAKDVMPNYITPTGFILLRVAGASLIFFLIHKFFINEKMQNKDLIYMFFCALFGVVINMLCFFEGLNLTTPINASVIMIMTPLMVYLISCFLSNKERSQRRLFGVVLGLLGAVLLITQGGVVFIDRSPSTFLGNILVFINALSYAIYLILVKSMMKKYHPITVLKTIFIFGFFIILPIGFSEISIDFSTWPTNIILKALFVVICTTCVAYFCNIYAITRLRPSTVAFYIYLQPLLASILSITFNKEELNLIQVAASICIFMGVYFVIQTNKI